MPPSSQNIRAFRRIVYRHYAEHGRDFPWRPPSLKLRKDKSALHPYQIVVSEIMLQQTQVARVAQKYPAFIKRFPSFAALGRASFSEILSAWNGLGYNRRALALHHLAKTFHGRYRGRLPSSEDELMRLPGIGKATAGSIRAFAFNEPAIFIETNIRSAYLYRFFQSYSIVSDANIFPLITRTLDKKNPREWYFALMDYGAFIKKRHSNPNRMSAHYTKQPSFTGSNRQIRGTLVRILVVNGALKEEHLVRIASGLVQTSAQRVRRALYKLSEERMVECIRDRYTIAGY